MIGVFGGTFDPVHLGHLRVAHEVWEDLGLDHVRFVPARVPPHRPQPAVAADARLGMVRAAVDGEPGFVVDTRELEREGPSYMADTLASLAADFPGRRLCLVLGMDAFNGFPGWERGAAILETAHLVITGRPGSRPSGAAAELLAERGVADPGPLRERPAGAILFHGVTQLEISATAIREGIAAGRDPRFLLTPAVIDYIERHGLYR